MEIVTQWDVSNAMSVKRLFVHLMSCKRASSRGRRGFGAGFCDVPIPLVLSSSTDVAYNILIREQTVQSPYDSLPDKILFTNLACRKR